jgi:hypothetical protein
MKKMAHLAAAAFAALLVYSLVQPVRPAAAQTPNLQGTYSLDPSTSPNVAQAIQNVTSQMGFFKQGIAQKRLTATNVPAQTLVITQTVNDITIQADGGQAIKTPLNGTPVTVTREDGSQVQAASVWQGSMLQRSFTAQDGVRTNSYRLSGNTLTESVQVTSPELPRPLTYQLIYHKAG